MHRRHPLTDESSITPLTVLLNILWLIFGGALAALGWFFASLLMAITIVGLPFAKAAYDNGLYTLWPFGARAANVRDFDGPVLGTGLFGFLGNIIWFVLAGWWLALGHLVAAVGLAITVIGLPFAWAHLKLAGFSLWPFGRTIVSTHDARPYYR